MSALPAIRLRGTGLVSSYGPGLAAAVDGLRAGRTGITPLTRFTLPFQDRIQVNQLDDRPYPPGEDGAVALIATAVGEALAAAGRARTDLHDAALIVGTSGFLFVAEAEYRRYLAEPGGSTAPLLRAPGHVTQRVAERLGVRGPVLTLSTACSSSANALLVAADFVRRGEVRRALVIGAEGLSSVSLGGFHSLMLLDPDGCRPFDARRRGMQVGEAVAAVLIEADNSDDAGASLLGGRSRHPASATAPGVALPPASMQSSRDTGASLLGGANLCDIHHVTSAAPDGSAMRAVMERALADAALSPAEIVLVKAHGTGSPDNDMAEAAAMRSLWGEALPPFTGLKRYLGHTLGACGIVELAALLGCLREGFVPPAAGFTEPDPELRITPLTTALAAPRGPVMYNYFGFGGNYASFIVRHD